VAADGRPPPAGFWTVYRRAIGLLAPERRLALGLAGANVVVAAIAFVEPILFGNVVDLLTGRSERLGIVATLALWAVVGVGGIVLSMLLALQGDRLAHRRRLAVLGDFFGHVLTLPPAFHDATHSAGLLKIMLTGTDNLFTAWLGILREHLATLVALAVLLPLTLFLNWRLALLLILLVVVFAAVTWFVLNATHAQQWAVQQHRTELAATAGDALGNVLLVQSFARLGEELRRVEELRDRVLAAQYPVLRWWALLTVITRTAATLATLALFAVGAWLSARGEATVGEIVMFMGFATMLIGRLQQLLGFVRSLFFQKPALAEFFQVLDTGSTVTERPRARRLERVRGALAFERVGFGYRPERPALRGIDLDIAPGSRVALVGPSGSGKSTLMALLLRLYDPDTGVIRLDGHDLRDVTLDSLRRNIGVVFQHTTLFQRSIAENLRIGRPDAGDAELIEAAKLAQAHDFVTAQPEGYATVVGERGARLSGGERQRLAIARALLKDPPILLMDEATSALDTTVEARLQAALETVMRGRTTLVIAHRLATIRAVDRVLVMVDGRLVEDGPYDDLVRRGGVFTELVEAQRLTSPPAPGDAPGDGLTQP
jgi:ATP-binding cassette subfamily B protein